MAIDSRREWTELSLNQRSKRFSLGAAIALTLLLTIPVEAQLSPGTLSRPHSGLDGPLSCNNCHKFGSGRPELKCGSCHVEIERRVSAKQGYHGRIVDSSTGDNDCSRCHAEHAGRDFALIRWPQPQANFDHRGQTGFGLDGKHASLTCVQCHTAKNISEAGRSEIKMKDLNRTFLGLGTSCLSCHKDEHRGQLSATCTNCHSQVTWKPATSFNHDATRFRLTGLHSKVACQGCHATTGSAEPAPRFKGIAFANCTDCHKDPHQGRFVETCTQCHTTAGWRAVKLADNRFNHNETKYRLTGLHSQVACTACHKNSDFSKPIASARCIDCHADRHKGQFVARSDRGDCQACHTVNGFKTATFTLEQHQKTRYSLAGKHAAVACDKCHEPKGEATDYHPAAAACLDCHQDPHDKQFLEAPLSNRCESCHNVSGFMPSTFNLTQHRETRFALAGAHAAIACIDCHQEKPATKDRRFRFADRSCSACHADPHGPGQEARGGCESCHSDNTWSKTLAFDHSKTQFPLQGAHQSSTCVSCHKVVAGNDKSRVIPFRGASQTCQGCHDDIHGGQFQRAATAVDCAKCHSSSAWRPSLFDHDKTDFPLSGSHRTVRCQACHATRQVAGRAITFYTEAKKECASCH